MPIPTPNELRDLSRRFREAAGAVADFEIKRTFAKLALDLAQLAETLERSGSNEKT